MEKGDGSALVMDIYIPALTILDESIDAVGGFTCSGPELGVGVLLSRIVIRVSR